MMRNNGSWKAISERRHWVAVGVGVAALAAVVVFVCGRGGWLQGRAVGVVLALLAVACAALGGWMLARIDMKRHLDRLADATTRLRTRQFGTSVSAQVHEAPFGRIAVELDELGSELARHERQWQASFRREAGQIEVLRRIAQNDPLDDALVLLTRFAEHQIEGALASVVIVDPATLRVTSCIAPSLPASYTDALVGLQCASGVGSCGTAIAERRIVVVDDIATDPLWKDYRALACAHGLGACWSHPIISTGHRVLGSFALYARTARAPSTEDIQIGQLSAEIAALSMERNRTAQALMQSEAEYRSLFERNPNPMWVCDARTRRFLAVNDRAIAHYGFTRERFLGMCEADLELHPHGPSRVREQGGEPPDGAARLHRNSSGQELLVEIAYFPLSFSGNDASLALITDVTYRRSLSRTIREQNELFASLMDSTVEAIYGLDSEGRCTFANGACERLLGYRADELVGMHMHTLIHRSQYEASVHGARGCKLHALQQPGTHTHLDDQVFVTKAGAVLPVECWAYPMMKGGAVCGTIVTFLDTTERRLQQDALRCQATLDMLTGLLNRTSFVDLLEQRVQSCLLSGARLFVGLVDLDGFKEINDSLGHEAGDQLLREVGSRLLLELPDGAALGRLGGDEFAFVVDTVDHAEFGELLKRLVQVMREPFRIVGMDVQISGSIGAAALPDTGRDVKSLMHNADAAMYRAKRESSGFVVGSEVESGNERRLLMSRLRHALHKQEFVLYFQPKVSLRGAAHCEIEALIRWMTPDRGMVAPSEFMPILELSDLIHPLTQWVIETAVEEVLALSRHAPDLTVAINISTRNLLDVRFPEKVKDLIDKHGFPPEKLKLEVTESAVMADPNRSLKALTEIHELGVGLAIDDFGTGYSSLSYLQRLPVDELKIDRSFVVEMAGNDAARTIVQSIIGLAHSLGIQVTAEGMETGSVLDQLRSLECDYAQGYFIARPMPRAALSEWLDHSPWAAPARAARTPLGASIP